MIAIKKQFGKKKIKQKLQIVFNDLLVVWNESDFDFQWFTLNHFEQLSNMLFDCRIKTVYHPHASQSLGNYNKLFWCEWMSSAIECKEKDMFGPLSS